VEYNARAISVYDVQQASRELERIGCDKTGVSIMANKAVFKTIKLEKISAKDANLLKQTFLAKGGEVAVTRGTADLSADYTDVLLMATMKQYKLAIAQLKLQPWGLPRLAKALEQVLCSSEKQLGDSGKQENWWLRQEKTLVMGILNITPDSFSDGGKYNTAETAFRHVEEMVRDGVDIIDIGAESTRPYTGAEKVSAEEEMTRLLPMLEKILARFSIPVSVDTYKAAVAAEALKLGAHMINDVWGLQHDPDMVKVVAEYNVPVVVMHNQDEPYYTRDVMSHICEFLRKSIAIALQAGIAKNRIIVDPGIGFAKTSEHNLTIMAKLEELQSLGCPVLLGTSRKRFIGEVLDLPVEERVEGTAATVALGISKGVNIIRVHDVKAMARIAKMTDAMIRSV
jgi:dihydropteroate synthase